MTKESAPGSTIEGVRHSMGRSSAAKVARTRAAIFAAVETIDEGEPVTVAKVVRRAGISRAAFYTHFSGLDELAVAVMHDTLHELSALHHEARGTTYAGWLEASTAMLRRNVEHIVLHRGLYLGVLGMPGGSEAFEAATVELARSIVAAFQAMPATPTRMDVEDAARFIASGTLTVIFYWMRTAPSMTADEMVARLLTFFPDMAS